MDKKNLVRQQPGDEGIAMDAAGQMVAEQQRSTEMAELHAL